MRRRKSRGALAVSLIAEIAQTFGLEPPPAEPLVEAEYLHPMSQADEGATAFFSGKPWKGLASKDLRHHEAAMYMFTPEVHRYYLPAFMIASLEDPGGADVIPDHIVFHLSRHADPFWWARLSVLSAEECDAVASFLRAIDDGSYGEQIAEALRGLERAKRVRRR
jgi:hypothetical protein